MSGSVVWMKEPVILPDNWFFYLKKISKFMIKQPKTRMSKYKCAYCGEENYLECSKLWTMHYCEKADREVRLVRLDNKREVRECPITKDNIFIGRDSPGWMRIVDSVKGDDVSYSFMIPPDRVWKRSNASVCKIGTMRAWGLNINRFNDEEIISLLALYKKPRVSKKVINMPDRKRAGFNKYKK